MTVPYPLIIDTRVLVLLVCFAVAYISSDVPLRPKEMVYMLEEGKRQYNLIQSKTNMPSFGNCWKEAVYRLHRGCQHLDDQIQSQVALAFANCFLEGAGLPTHDCDRSEPAQDGCLKSMPDRAFIAYTEFFTHTQSMCFFIMSQVWHEETEKTIDKLSTSAADVARQLEASEELQSELLQHQQRSVLIQQELLENGVSLGSMLHESRDSLNLIFNEFRVSTLEQQRLLSMVFHHLSTLQSWIVGEVSWVDSIAFYIPSFAFVYFLTSAQRTANARIPGLIILLIAGLIERFISYVLLNDGGEPGSFQPVDVINERLSWWVWLVRRSAIVVNTGGLMVTLYRFRDREEVMHQLLEQIQRQNEELLKHIQGSKHEVEGLNKSGKLDMVDGLGYMAVLANSSSSLSGPVVKSVPTINGIRTPVRTINSSIPNVSSAFKPIREDSPLESSCLTDGDRSEASGPVSSTPKAKSRRKTSSVETSPGSTRYNLRKSKSAALSPV